MTLAVQRSKLPLSVQRLAQNSAQSWSQKFCLAIASWRAKAKRLRAKRVSKVACPRVLAL
jgi:hypothetical protein